MNAKKAGSRIGKSIARDVIAENMPRKWTGIDAQDGDFATINGIEPDTDQWQEMKTAAKIAYLEYLGARRPS